MTDPTTQLQMFDRARAEFDRRVRAVGDGQWDNATPCTEWDVRALVAHLTDEMLWVPPLVGGETIAGVGDRFAGDQLGDDPVGAWSSAADAAAEALHEDGALGRTVHLSFGDTDATDYMNQMTADLTVHSWDLARGIGADDALDPDLVDAILPGTVAAQEMLAASGLFGSPLPVSDNATPQTKLLAMVGRRA